MSRSGDSLRRETRRLRARVENAAVEEHLSERSPYERALLKAVMRATPAELSRLEELRAVADSEGRAASPDRDQEFYALWETLLERVSKMWADDMRARRCLFARELRFMERAYGDRGALYYRIATGAHNRGRVVREQIEAPVTDPQEAKRRAAEVLDAATDPRLRPHEASQRVLSLIGWPR